MAKEKQKTMTRDGLSIPVRVTAKSVPDEGKADCAPIEQEGGLSVRDAALSETSTEKWQRKFAMYAEQDVARSAAGRSSLPKPKFNHAVWRHRPLGEPEKRTNISRKKGAK
jgi:hypothetical protein